MSDRGKGKANLTMHTTARRKGYLYHRAQRMEATLSKFTGQVLEWWFAQGCPPVSEVDAKMPCERWDEGKAFETYLPKSEEASSEVKEAAKTLLRRAKKKSRENGNEPVRSSR